MTWAIGGDHVGPGRHQVSANPHRGASRVCPLTLVTDEYPPFTLR